MGDKWTSPSEHEIREMREADQAVEQDKQLDGRRYPRLKLHARITLKSDTNFFMGFSENISQGGVFVSTMSPPEVGEFIELVLKVGDAEPIQVRGVVRWVRLDPDGTTSGCGVQFVDLTEQTERELKRLVDRLKREPLFYEA